MQRLAILLAGIIVTSGLAGCFANPEPVPEPEPGPFDFGMPLPITTFYHFANYGDAEANHSVNGTSVLTGNNTPFFAEGTYYATGFSTFEPTLGVTSSGYLFMTSWGSGIAGATAMVRCFDLPGLAAMPGGTLEYVCEDVYDPTLPITNSNDPYLYVDPWTDRLVKFDMHALLGMTYEYSDNNGESWELVAIPVSGGYTPQDHQTIASVPVPDNFPHPVFHETIYVFCINTGAQGPIGSQCDSSFDGGITWEGQVMGHPLSLQCHGLSGHLVGANDGAIYRGNPSCDGPAAYRSLDGGRTWTEHTITTVTGSAGHEVAVTTDEASNLHAFWIGDDDLPYYSNSRDRGDTWREPMMVAPPGINGTGFPTIAAGADGRVAFGYIGSNGSEAWHGFMGVITDAWGEAPLITTVAVNLPDDVLDDTEDCGYRRCGGFGDFIDIVIDVDGRPWIALSHSPAGDIGLFGTLARGPSLRGELSDLAPLPLGGDSTLPSG